MSQSTANLGPSIIEVKDLSYATLGARPLIHNVSFRIQQGEIGLLTGPNGIGKSTLLKILLGAHKPSSGQVTLNSPVREISYLPQMQNRAFHVPITLREVIEFGRPVRNAETFDQDLAHMNLLEPGQLDSSWNQASGGQRQKALITMSLVKPTTVVLFDEPLNHLDADGQAKFFDVIQYATKVRGKTILMVGHGEPIQALLGTKVVHIPLDHYAAAGAI